MIGAFQWCVSYSQLKKSVFCPVWNNEEMSKTFAFWQANGWKVETKHKTKPRQWSKTFSGITKSSSRPIPLSWNHNPGQKCWNSSAADIRRAATSCPLSPFLCPLPCQCWYKSWKKNKQPAKKQAKKNLDNSFKIALFQESFASKNSYSPAKMAIGQILTFLVPIIIITILQQLRSFPTQLSNNFLLSVFPF